MFTLITTIKQCKTVKYHLSDSLCGFSLFYLASILFLTYFLDSPLQYPDTALFFTYISERFCNTHENLGVLPNFSITLAYS